MSKATVKRRHNRPQFLRATPIKRTGFQSRRAGLEMLEPRRVLSSVSWTGGGDGHSWGDAANWGGALPGPADDVKINVAGPLTITHSSGNDTIHSIISTSSQVSLDLSGGSLSVLSDSTINGALTNEAVLSVEGGEMDLDGGVTSTGGQFSVASGATITLGGVDSLDSASSVSGAGTVRIVQNAQHVTSTIGGTYDVTGETDVLPFVNSTVDFSGNVQSVGTTLRMNGQFGNQGPTVVTFHTTPINVSDLSLNGVTLTSGPIQTASMEWGGATISGTGLVNVTNSLSLGNANADLTLDGRIFNNFAAAQWTAPVSGTDNIHLIDGAVFNNESGASLQIENQVGADVQVVGDGTFNNAGSLIRNTANETDFNCAFQNTGSVEVQSGDLELDGGVTSTGGQFSVASGATITLGGVDSLDSASSVSGAGTVRIVQNAQHVTSTIGGTYDVTGETDVLPFVNSTVDFSGNVQSVGTTLRMNGQFGNQGPTVVTFHTTPINVSDLSLNGVTLTSGPIQTASMEWGGATISGTGLVNVTNSLSLGNANADLTLDGRIFNNFAAAQWTAPVSGTDNIHLIDGAVFNNESGASLQIENQVGADVQVVGDGTFNNAGSLIRNTANETDFNCAFQNTGSVEVQSGDLELDGGVTSTGGQFSVASGATITLGGVDSLDSASSVSGAGTVRIVQNAQHVTSTIGGTYDVTGETDVLPFVNSTVDFSGNVQSVGALNIQGYAIFSPIVATPIAAQNISLNGTLDGTASFNVAGNYTQSSGSTLDITIGGSNPVTQFSQIDVGGTATLAGILNVALVNGFSPPPNSSFKVLQFGTRNGSTFGTINGLAAANLSAAYDATSLTLHSNVTTDPLTVTVLPSTKTYGQLNPTFTVSYSGFMPGDNANVLGGALTFTTTATPNSDVGNYLVTASGLTSDKYDIHYISGTLAVTQAPLTVEVNDAVWVIGKPFPPAFSVTYSGFVLGQDASALGGTLAFSTTASSSSTVGAYAVSASGLNSTDYAITYISGTLSVIVDPSLGILLLSPATKGELAVSGNGDVAVTDGDIVLDSSSTQAVKVSGNGEVSAVQIDATGVSSSGKGTVQGTVDTADVPLADPLAGLAAPSVPSTVRSASPLNISGSGHVQLQPGLYIGGIAISGQVQVTLVPGIYYLKGGGLSVSGQATVSGTDVLVYNAPSSASDTINISGQATVNLTGMYGGPYQGIAIFQDRTSSAALNVTGQASLNLVGTVYAAGATLNISGNGSLNIYGNSQLDLADHLIVADLQVSGNGEAFVDVDGNAVGPNNVDYYFASY